MDRVKVNALVTKSIHCALSALGPNHRKRVPTFRCCHVHTQITKITHTRPKKRQWKQKCRAISAVPVMARCWW